MISISVSAFFFSVLIGLSLIAIILLVYIIRMKRKTVKYKDFYDGKITYDERKIFN